MDGQTDKKENTPVDIQQDNNRDRQIEGKTGVQID